MSLLHVFFSAPVVLDGLCQPVNFKKGRCCPAGFKGHGSNCGQGPYANKNENALGKGTCNWAHANETITLV